VLGAAVHPAYWELPFLNAEERNLVRERLVQEMLWCVPGFGAAAEGEELGSSDEELDEAIEKLPLLTARAEIRCMKKLMRENDLKPVPFLLSLQLSASVQLLNLISWQNPMNSAPEFWKRNGSSMPHLQRLARILLSIPATGAAAERTFSTAGLCDRGGKGSSENIDALVFVRRNLPIMGATTLEQVDTMLRLLKISKTSPPSL
jgi:hAT family C-terminal dimerisation region